MKKTTGPVGGPAAGDGASSVSPSALLPVSPLDPITVLIAELGWLTIALGLCDDCRDREVTL
jgi:hypothetical protein